MKFHQVKSIIILRKWPSESGWTGNWGNCRHKNIPRYLFRESNYFLNQCLNCINIHYLDSNINLVFGSSTLLRKICTYCSGGFYQIKWKPVFTKTDIYSKQVFTWCGTLFPFCQELPNLRVSRLAALYFHRKKLCLYGIFVNKTWNLDFERIPTTWRCHT